MHKGLSAAKNDDSWKDCFALYPRLLVRLVELLMIELSALAHGRADLVRGILSGPLEACQAGLARGTFPVPESTRCDGYQSLRRGKQLDRQPKSIGQHRRRRRCEDRLELSAENAALPYISLDKNVSQPTGANAACLPEKGTGARSSFEESGLPSTFLPKNRLIA